MNDRVMTMAPDDSSYRDKPDLKAAIIPFRSIDQCVKTRSSAQSEPVSRQVSARASAAKRSPDYTFLSD
ncbi:hypothetical protein J6590_019001 [Homalodisca vitripennis]|nr:hypothetical protein J6590_019001 [Homalodisca vitripennis]